jgi:uncharacterized membrane protein
MSNEHQHGVESNAAIFRHPIHPMLIPFPIAALVGALVTDIVFSSTGNGFWATASFWLLGAGVVTGIVAAVPGMIDYASIAQVRRLTSAHVHAGGNVVALGLAFINLAMRWDNPAAGPGASGIFLSALVVALIGVTGWIGGELSYRHRIGVMADRNEGTAETTRSGRVKTFTS